MQKDVENNLDKTIYSSILDNTSEGVIIVDEFNRIIEVNKSCENITGYSFSEIEKENPKIFSSGNECVEIYNNILNQLKTRGFWIGELQNRHKNGNIYPIIIKIHKFYNKETKKINYFGIFSDISSVSSFNNDLLHLAYHDSLTNLPNRLKLEAQLEYVVNNSKRNNLKFAVLFLDLDDFKRVNDTLGHAYGDEVLISFANKLKEITRTNDMIARVGGDEFIVVLSDINNYLFIQRVCSKILAIVNNSVKIKNTNFNIGVSIGIAVYPENGSNLKTLINNADFAMYHAKNKGKNNFAFFSNKMNKSLEYKSKKAEKLLSAIKNDEFVLHFQPEIDLKTNEVFALEILARWKKFDKLYMPDEFINDLNHTNLIIEFENLILTKACKQLKIWQESNFFNGVVSVNISGKHLENGNLFDTVVTILKLTSLKAEYLELEFSESDIMKVSTKSLVTLKDLSLLGVGLSIDNFGEGFSSFNHIRKCSISKLKIDKSYIDSLVKEDNDEAIIKSILDLGLNMGLLVIAEGVEFPLQDEIIKKNSCTKVQGFFYAKPMSDVNFEEWYKSFNLLNIKT